MKFTAILVESSTDAAVVNALFADPQTNPDQPTVLMFSRSIELPDSAYYFEINDQSTGRYGGLTRVQVSQNSIEAHLEPGVVQDFGNEDLSKVQVNFEIDDELYQSTLEALRIIFANADILVVE
jgi:hypothetical protein